MGGGGSWNPVDVVVKPIENLGKDINQGFNNVVNEVGNGLDSAGKAINQAAIDTGNAIEKGIHDTGSALEKAGQDVNYVFKEYTPWALFDSTSQLRGNLRDFNDAVNDIFKGGGDDKNNNNNSSDDSDLAYTVGTAGAKRRKNYLALQKGFLSTIRGSKNANAASALSSMSSSGKTKLGQ